jgi:SAM-dependent methyltransferase
MTTPHERPPTDPTAPSADEQAWFEANRAMWDERVPIHVAGDFYDVAGFEAGASTLRPFEVDELGDVQDRELLHLQCHFGLDTLSWARRGAKVTGLDFSAPAVEAARKVAERVGIAARFVHANVYDARAALDRDYDVVYTGLGALCWLPDLDRWADVVAGLTRPGGTVYLSEFHPITDTLGDEALTFERDYFGGGPHVWDEPGTYAALEASTTANLSYEWIHPVSDVIQALLSRGLVLQSFREHDYTLFPRWPFLVNQGNHQYRLPDDLPKLPLMYSLRLTKPN